VHESVAVGPPETIDYPSLLARERARARAAKLRVTKRT
jgi:hypothetical protein